MYPHAISIRYVHYRGECTWSSCKVVKKTNCGNRLSYDQSIVVVIKSCMMQLLGFTGRKTNYLANMCMQYSNSKAFDLQGT